MTLPVVLVTCASGSTGREVVKQLSASNKFIVRAGVRDIPKASSLFSSLSNVEIVKLDETDATSAAAFEGIYGVYLIISNPQPEDPCFPTWFKYAKESKGIKHFVFHSAVTANEHDPVLINRQTFKQQEEIRKSGIPYTFLRPTFFNQNVEKFLAATLPQGFFAGCSNNGRYTLVDVRDIASVAVKVLLEGEPHFSKSYPLTTQIITDEEIAKTLTEKLGRKIEYINLPVDQYSAELAKADIPPSLVQAIVELEKEKEEERVLPVHPHLVELLGRPPISFEQYVTDVAPSLAL